MLRNQHNDQGQQPFWDRFDGQGPYEPPQNVDADDAGKQVNDQQIGFTFFLIATANAGSKRRAECGSGPVVSSRPPFKFYISNAGHVVRAPAVELGVRDEVGLRAIGQELHQHRHLVHSLTIIE